MESTAGTWQHLLSIAGTFLAVVLSAFALIVFVGLLAHSSRRKARQQPVDTQADRDAKKSAEKCEECEK